MRALVTGAAGFIGSHLASRLLEEGHDVTGIDCLTPYYEVELKRANIRRVEQTNPSFVFEETDLRTDDVDTAVAESDVVFHLAAQPGVRASWGTAFADYTGHNILATQRLLEAARQAGESRPRIVFASSSSVYGEAETYPTPETVAPRPVSPYGVTKLAAEHLIAAYRANFGVEAVVLRYFTVYGPGQRPDMAFTRFISSVLNDKEIEVFGDGEQTRDVTFVDDVVRATIAAAATGGDKDEGGPINIAGGSQVSVNRVIELIGKATERTPKVTYLEVAAGDVRQTGADTSRARSILEFEAEVGVEEGLAREIDWLRDAASTGAGVSE